MGSLVCPLFSTPETPVAGYLVLLLDGGTNDAVFHSRTSEFWVWLSLATVNNLDGNESELCGTSFS